MSKGARFPIGPAIGWALEAKFAIGSLSPRVEVAGSIRRKRADVGDIDLVVLDWTHQDPWQHARIGNALMQLGYVQTKDGEKIASFDRPGAAPLDLYFATPETWGITLLVRTGSAAHNIRLVEHGKRLLPARTLHVSRGIVDTAGKVVAGADELEIFAALKLKFVQPEDREAPEYQGLVRAEATA